MIIIVKHTLDLCSISKMPYEKGVEEEFCQVWKYLFQATDKRNYAIEAFTLLTQYFFFTTKHCRTAEGWRFVNVYGSPERNLSCELHMEHLNQLVKTAIDGLGANKTENAISRASKAMGVIAEIMESYDSALKYVRQMQFKMI